MRPPNGSSAFASVTAERSSKGGGITISALLANVCYRLVCARHQLEGLSMKCVNRAKCIFSLQK